MAIFGRKQERNVYFPWERRGVWGVARQVGQHVSRWVLLGLVIAIVYALYRDNVNESKRRLTELCLRKTALAVDAYLEDHDGTCPPDITTLLAPVGTHPAYLQAWPKDGWGNPLRLECAQRESDRAYFLSSDGPDGLPYGLDRILSP